MCNRLEDFNNLYFQIYSTSVIYDTLSELSDVT